MRSTTPPRDDRVRQIRHRNRRELRERPAKIAAFVEHVAVEGAGFREARIQPHRLAAPEQRPFGVAVPVEGEGKIQRRIGALAVGREGEPKVPLRPAQETLAQQAASHAEHEFHVLIVPHGDEAFEDLEGRRAVPQLQQDVSEAGQRFFVFRIEPEDPGEGGARPGILLSGQTRIAE